VTDQMRQTLIEMVGMGASCRKSAKDLGISYNNAKVICRVYRNEGRKRQIPKHLKRFVHRFKKKPDSFRNLLT
jgi:transposase